MTDLAERRRTAGLTQIQLAIEAGCSRSSIAILEAGYQPRHSDVLPRLLAVLEQSTNSNGAPPQGPAAKETRDADAITSTP